MEARPIVARDVLSDGLIFKCMIRTREMLFKRTILLSAKFSPDAATIHIGKSVEITEKRFYLCGDFLSALVYVLFGCTITTERDGEPWLAAIRYYLLQSEAYPSPDFRALV